MNTQVAVEKLKHYCAYQERCHQEVKEKLQKMGVFGIQANEVIAILITENYLNEERFAKAFAGGKFRIKGWGKLKIKQALKLKKVSDYSIKKGLQEIEEDDYLNTLTQWIGKLSLKYDYLNAFEKKGKIAQVLSQKGFESNLIWDMINQKVSE